MAKRSNLGLRLRKILVEFVNPASSLSQRFSFHHFTLIPARAILLVACTKIEDRTKRDDVKCLRIIGCKRMRYLKVVGKVQAVAWPIKFSSYLPRLQTLR